jgi:hypothetical protein
MESEYHEEPTEVWDSTELLESSTREKLKEGAYGIDSEGWSYREKLGVLTDESKL